MAHQYTLSLLGSASCPSEIPAGLTWPEHSIIAEHFFGFSRRDVEAAAQRSRSDDTWAHGLQ